MGKSDIVRQKHQLVGIVEVRNSNPNGESSADNSPRRNAYTGQGIISADSTKRKMRFTTQIIHPDIPLLVDAGGWDGSPRQLVDGAGDLSVIDYMYKKFWDVRTFGGALAGCEHSIDGAVQVGFGLSVSPIEIAQISMTRKAIATDEKFSEDGANTMFGSKQQVVYGVYILTAEVSPRKAEKSGFTEGDLEVFTQSFIHMYDFDKTANRSEVNMRRVIDFVHDDFCGNQRSKVVYDAVKVIPVPDVQAGIRPPRHFSDYTITIDQASLGTDKITIRELRNL